MVLHRVTQSFQGEIDSVRVAGDGTFRFVLPAVPDPGDRHEIYFASVRHHEILYFGAPVADLAQLDSLYVIPVHDTAAAKPGGETFPVATRNLFVESVEEGWQATDLIRIRNEGQRTFVAAEGEAVWVYPLPSGATDLEVGQSDLASDAAWLVGSELWTSAPIPPGERLYIFTYRLPGLDVTVPLPGLTEEMDLLVREPAPALTVSVLAGSPPVEVEPGSTYRRYTGAGLRDVSVELSLAQEVQGPGPEWLAVGLGLILTVAGVLAIRIRGTGPSQARRPPGARERLLEEVARLDETHCRHAPHGGDEEAAYRRRRSELLARLQKLS